MTQPICTNREDPIWGVPTPDSEKAAADSTIHAGVDQQRRALALTILNQRQSDFPQLVECQRLENCRELDVALRLAPVDRAIQQAGVFHCVRSRFDSYALGDQSRERGYAKALNLTPETA